MKVVYASRTGNVESIVSKLGIEDALKIEDGSETVEDDTNIPDLTGKYSAKLLGEYKWIPLE